MDSRTHSRIRLSVPVKLFCPEQNNYHNRTTSDISPGGLFVSGAPCGRAGYEFDVFMNCADKDDPLCLRAQIARVASNGVGMRFTGLSPGQEVLLQNIIQPNWDGKDVFEGLMIFAAREQIVDLAGWLRLTSLVCREYRRCALLHSKEGFTGPTALFD